MSSEVAVIIAVAVVLCSVLLSVFLIRRMQRATRARPAVPISQFQEKMKRDEREMRQISDSLRSEVTRIQQERARRIQALDEETAIQTRQRPQHEGHHA